MPDMTTVIYQGHAAAVVGPGGITFPRGQRVEVPAELAIGLGPDFKISAPKEDKK